MVPKKYKDISDKIFGNWLVVAFAGTSKIGSKWKCLCLRCSNLEEVSRKNLVSPTPRFCKNVNCTLNRSKIRDLSGLQFGRWSVLHYVERAEGQKSVLWLCECACGEKRAVKSTSLVAGESKSCGCLQKEIVSALRGAKSPHWNPKLPNSAREKRRNGKHAIWAAEVKLRDDYTCQICDKRGVYLESHHLNSYKYFPEQRYEVDNGICLCKECHRDFHKCYKGVEVTKSMFAVWKKKAKAG